MIRVYAATLYLFVVCGAFPISAQTDSLPLGLPPLRQREAGNRPAYSDAREDEDWSLLADRSQRRDIWDPIKYVALPHEGWFLTVGGEARQWFEFVDNQNWGDVPGGNAYLLQRYMLHTDWHFGTRTRFFAQLKSGLENGRRGGPRFFDKNTLDVAQAFFDFTLLPSSAGEHKPRLVLRVGRQALEFGTGRVVSPRDGLNVRRNFDGARLTAHFAEWQADAFGMKVDTDNPGIFDDVPAHDSTFWGLYVVGPVTLPALPKPHIDLYYLGLDRKRVVFDAGTGRDQRHTAGARLWGQGEGFDYDIEVHQQWGRFGPGALRAWGFSSGTGYSLPVRLSPRLAINTGWVSGNGDPHKAGLQTYYPPYAAGPYFGWIGANGPLNVRGIQPQITLASRSRISLTLDSYFFWRQSLTDGVYATPGSLLRTGQLSRARYLATQPEVSFQWKIDPHTTLIAVNAFSVPGKFLHETSPDRTITYVGAFVVYRF